MAEPSVAAAVAHASCGLAHGAAKRGAEALAQAIILLGVLLSASIMASHAWFASRLLGLVHDRSASSRGIAVQVWTVQDVVDAAF